MSESKSTVRSRRWVPWFAALALAVFVAWSISHLFSLRFARGDVYPAYSSLRTDPLGSKVLADAIAELPGFAMERNYRSLARLKTPQPATLIFLSLPVQEKIDEGEFAELDRMIARGCRVIISCKSEFSLKQRPANTPAPSASPASTPAPASPAPSTSPASTPTPSATPNPRATPRPNLFQADKGPEFRDLAVRWGVDFYVSETAKASSFEGTAEPALELDGKAPVPWHSALYFGTSNDQWRTLYRCNKEPVIIERTYGRGSIVMCSDSYLFSNEAMRKDRASGLIAALIGSPQTVVFDEVHHGVVESTNIAGLVRKYDLGGTVLAVLIVAGLFIWKNTVSFLPPRDRQVTGEAHVIGRDANEGFINLLRRSVPKGGLLALCVAEWRKMRGRRIRDEEIAHVDAVVRAHQARSGKDVAAAYQSIADGIEHR